MNHLFNDGLPEAILLAVSNDQYDPGESDYTPSSLNSAAYQRRLEKDTEAQLKHFKDSNQLKQYSNLLRQVQQPASKRIWALLGSAVHYMIELAGDKAEHLECEHRFYGTVKTLFGDSKIGAQIDILDTIKNAIFDMKVTSTYVFAGGIKPEWEAQLNVQRWCVWKESGRVVDSLNIVAIWKDWSLSRKHGVYPDSQCSNLEVNVWPMYVTEAWIREKVVERESAMQADSLDEVTPCSDVEVWAKPTKYAVTKPGASRAMKVFDVETEAIEYSSTKAEAFVKTRPGARTRCEGFCDVAYICPAFNAHKKEYSE